MAACRFWTFWGIVAILGTLMVQGKCFSGKSLAYPQQLAGCPLDSQNQLQCV